DHGIVFNASLPLYK
ncbi:DUF1672 domain-containing protein, partial [Staphylococcus aureus]